MVREVSVLTDSILANCRMPVPKQARVVFRVCRFGPLVAKSLPFVQRWLIHFAMQFTSLRFCTRVTRSPTLHSHLNEHRVEWHRYFQLPTVSCLSHSKQ